MSLLARNFFPPVGISGAKWLLSDIQGAGLPLETGNIYYVNADSGNDGNDGLDPTSAFATLAKAYDSATTNNNDVIVLGGNASNVNTAMITWSKSRIHVVGTGNYGACTTQSSKVDMNVTANTADLYSIKVTGNRNSFSNIKFISNNTLLTHLSPVYAGGEGNVYNNCTFALLVQLDQTDMYSIIIASDSSTFNNCEFGQDTIQRSAAQHTALFGVDASNVVKDCYFNNCSFKMNTTTAGCAHLQVGTGDCVNFTNIFRGTAFMAYVNAGAGAVANTVNVITNTSITGKLMFDQNTFTGVGTKMAASTNNVGVWITAPSTPTAATSGVSVLAA